MKFLNETLHYCPEHQAVFQEKTTQEQSIEYFDQVYANNSKDWAETQKTETHQDSPPNWKGKKFTDEDDHWEHEGKFVTLLVEKTTDKKSIQRVIHAISNIEKILERKLLHREFITIVLGTKDSCIGKSQGNCITLPQLKNGILWADAVAQIKIPGKPEVSIENILLHEIGHTLRKHLAELREDLALSIRDEFFEFKPLLDKISPHYLGDQFPKLAQEIASLQTPPPTKEKVKGLTEITKKLVSEIFAESIRFYYLEPIIEGKLRHPEKCKAPYMSQILQRIFEEQTEGLRKIQEKRPMPLSEPEEKNP